MDDLQLMKKYVHQLSEQAIIRNQKREDWLKHVLTGASGLLAILISLKTGKSNNDTTHYFYISTIGLFALGILSGTIFLFASVNALHRHIRYRQKQILEGRIREIGFATNVEPLKIFDKMRIVCYISFFLSIPSLVTYAILMDY